MDVVCAVIVTGDGRFLACRRPPGKPLAGCWEFPGGKVERGETHEAALQRELREELGVGVRVGEALTPVCGSTGPRAFRLLPFVCELADGEPQALEHEELRWCGDGDWRDLEWAPADLPILAEWAARTTRT